MEDIRLWLLMCFGQGCLVLCCLTGFCWLFKKMQTLFEFRFEFLRVVCNHEHYVPLNLPMPFGKGRILRFQGERILKLVS